MMPQVSSAKKNRAEQRLDRNRKTAGEPAPDDLALAFGPWSAGKVASEPHAAFISARRERRKSVMTNASKASAANVRYVQR